MTLVPSRYPHHTIECARSIYLTPYNPSLGDVYIAYSVPLETAARSRVLLDSALRYPGALFSAYDKPWVRLGIYRSTISRVPASFLSLRATTTATAGAQSVPNNITLRAYHALTSMVSAALYAKATDALLINQALSLQALLPPKSLSTKTLLSIDSGLNILGYLCQLSSQLKSLYTL